jgi:ribosomal protein S18 acetylase RimI-like enzyme
VGPVVRWRPLRPDDAEAYAALHAEARRAAGAPDEVLTVHEIRHRLEDPGIALPTDTMAGWSADGQLLAAGTVWCRPSPVHLARAIVMGDVRPDARRQAVGRVLLGWQIARAAERLDREAPGSLPRRVDLFVPRGEADREALARRAGMVPLRWFVKMSRSTDVPVAVAPVPPGIEVVTWSDARSDAVLDARNDAWRDHWAYEPMPESVWRHLFRDDPTFLPAASRLALEGDRVVGFVLCTEQLSDEGGDGRTAWLDHIGVRRDARRRGLASALMAASLVALAEEGFRTVSLDVDADSPTGALGLYERAGFRAIRTETLFGLELTPGP